MNTQEISDLKIGARVKILTSADHVHSGKTGVVVMLDSAAISTKEITEIVKVIAVVPRIRVKFDGPTNGTAECLFSEYEIDPIDCLDCDGNGGIEHVDEREFIPCPGCGGSGRCENMIKHYVVGVLFDGEEPIIRRT